MKNITELRNELIVTFDKLKLRQIDISTAKATVALGNTIIKSAAIEIDYNKITGNKKKIQFLENGKS